jgi:hypothetical protein
MIYPHIAQLGRLSAMEKVGVRAISKALRPPKPPKLPPVAGRAGASGLVLPDPPKLPAGPSPLPAGSPTDIPRIRQRHNVGKVTTSSGELSPNLKRLADKMGIPHDEYINILRGYNVAAMPTSKQIRSALLGGGATIGAVGGAAYLENATEKTRTVEDATRAVNEGTPMGPASDWPAFDRATGRPPLPRPPSVMNTLSDVFSGRRNRQMTDGLRRLLEGMRNTTSPGPAGVPFKRHQDYPVP